MTVGLILAAGVSSRMGKFKPMLPIGKTTLIKRLISQMRETGVEKIVVVTGYLKNELEEHLKDENVLTVHNERFFGTQMLDSVKIGIRKVKESFSDCEKVLLSPADVVMSPRWVFEAILDTSSDFVRPVYHGKSGHPVLISKNLFDFILSYDGDEGLRGAVEASGTKITDINVEEPNILLDADTKTEYRKAVAEYDKVLGAAGHLHPDVELKLVTDREICNESFVQLLELVDKSGSLVNAAYAMKISYTKVWKMLKYVESVTSVKLVERTVGGEDGGSSVLTEAGKDFLSRYKAMRTELDGATEAIFSKYFEDFRI
ncbi:MAG: NTP transferase domain-containing protein [Eubacteriales bacterium]|nr:NTP transferase domain-containing protein [Eubacteriales bacterium]